MKSTPPRLRRPRRAQIHLPPMTADEALRLVAMLDRAITAIWRAHGDAMADHQAMRGIETPPPRDAVPDGYPNPPDDTDF